ncbi:unnamed protein product [Notodromas monacha]|nr:unnamed protein product [Notodromas monacha]CAG0914287.1 unnamed protein product [Notodromas monacha]
MSRFRIRLSLGSALVFRSTTLLQPGCGHSAFVVRSTPTLFDSEESRERRRCGWKVWQCGFAVGDAALPVKEAKGKEAPDPVNTSATETVGSKVKKKKMMEALPSTSVDRNFITAIRAMSDFLLKPSDLEGLRKTRRRSPFELEPPIVVFWRKDVEER